MAVYGLATLAFPANQQTNCNMAFTQPFSNLLHVTLGVNYDNSSASHWQRIDVPSCTTLYAAMRLAGWNLQTNNYGGYGVFILSINGVSQSTTTEAYWQWYELSGSHWTLGPLGASSYIVKNDDTLLWYLAPVNAGPPPAP